MRYKVLVEYTAVVQEAVFVEANDADGAKELAQKRDGTCELVTHRPISPVAVVGSESLPNDRYAMKIEEAFDALYDHAIELQLDWDIYQAVFGASEQRIRELNRRTGLVFGQYQVSLRDRLQLAIARMTDDDKRVLSLRSAIRMLPSPSLSADKSTRKNFADARDALIGKYEEVRQFCDPIIQHRNRRIAHNDKAVLLEDEFLPGISRAMMREAVTKITDLLDKISRCRNDCSLHYELPEVPRHCELLFKVLELGNHEIDISRDRKRAIREKMARGEIPPDADIAQFLKSDLDSDSR
jgi:hypothetical protein